MRYKCDICQWVYDEATEGKSFNDLPDNYECPVCGAGKEMFSKVEE